MSISVRLPYPPSVNHYYKRTRNGGVRIGDKGKRYRKDVDSILKNMRVEPMSDERLSISINAHPPDRRTRDLDNIFKCLFDALQHGGAFDDDSQIKHIDARMTDADKKNPCVDVYISPID